MLSTFALIADEPQVCALSKRAVILQSSDMMAYNELQPVALHQAGNNNNNNNNAGGSTAIASKASALQNIIANAGLSYEDVLNDDFQFDMDGHDVMVFLHIQKTGGTSFGRHLVRDLDLKVSCVKIIYLIQIIFNEYNLQRPCECQRQRKRCYCFRPHRNENWLFSRYSTGWKCGLHADWTELTSCVDVELDKNEGETAKRRYFYISLLREPISRYMSEYRHVRRGATWKGSRHWCLGRQATAVELPPCYKGKDWLDVDLDQFAGCESNLAANRQTRMLADLALVGCYNKSSMPAHERDRVMLASAKRNLAAMAYFGLTEYQKVGSSQFKVIITYLTLNHLSDVPIHLRGDLQPALCHPLRAAQCHNIRSCRHESASRSAATHREAQWPGH